MTFLRRFCGGFAVAGALLAAQIAAAQLASAAPVEDAIKACTPSAPTPASLDVAAYFPTGGTIGLPTLVQHTHANEVAAATIGALSSGSAATTSSSAARVRRPPLRMP